MHQIQFLIVLLKIVTNQSPLSCTNLWVTYHPLVFAELGDLRSFILHPGDQQLQFSLEVLPLLRILSSVDLTHQLLMLTDKGNKYKTTLIKGSLTCPKNSE